MDGQRVVMIKLWDCVLYQRSHLNSTVPDKIGVVYAIRFTFCSRSDDARPSAATSKNERS